MVKLSHSLIKQLLLLTIATLIPLMANSSIVTVGDLGYDINLSTGKATLKGLISDVRISDLIIPDYITVENVNYPVVKIDDSAFVLKSIFGTITFGENIEEIGNYAFGYCNLLTGNLKLPDNLKTIGASAFNGCQGLSGDLEIPNSVIEIGDEAFKDCTGFNGNLILSDGLQSIGKEAFYNCIGLKGDINISGTVKEIKDYAFKGCLGFRGDLILNDGVESIGLFAFKDCKNLKGLYLSERLYTIGDCAFSGCSNMTGALKLPPHLIEIGFGAFEDCSGFTSLSMPNSIAKVGYYAFDGCTGLSGEIKLPVNLTMVPISMFFRCSNITSVIIQSNVVTMGRSAFFGCTSLTSITCQAIYPPIIDITDEKDDIATDNIFQCFSPSTYMGAILYVPKGSVQIYKEATGWKKFVNIQAIPESGEEPNPTPEPEEIECNISFSYPDGLLGTGNVKLKLPIPEEIEGYTFSKWIVVGGDLADGIVIQALYIENTSTNIYEIEAVVKSSPNKFIKNGQMFILKDGKTYNLSGVEIR